MNVNASGKKNGCVIGLDGIGIGIEKGIVIETNNARGRRK
jgi:hypothetical protein